jgi:hypothetical protein
MKNFHGSLRIFGSDGASVGVPGLLLASRQQLFKTILPNDYADDMLLAVCQQLPENKVLSIQEKSSCLYKKRMKPSGNMDQFFPNLPYLRASKIINNENNYNRRTNQDRIWQSSHPSTSL